MFFNEDSIIEFQKAASKAFKFLKHDFHYKELEISDYANPCSVVFINKSYKVRVLIEGINWGSNSRVAFGHIRKDKFQNYDLNDLANALSHETHHKFERGELDQHGQLEVLSKVLKNIGYEVLNGNFSICRKIDEIRIARSNELYKNS